MLQRVLILNYRMKELKKEAIELLKKLIKTQSLSGEEQGTAKHIADWFVKYHIPFETSVHNVWAVNKHYDASKPTILLNSHHDTVRANKGYTNNPLDPFVKDGKLFGLGSNDAGGCLVSLLAAFTYFYEQADLAYNLVIVASAEEESSGPNGLNSMLAIIPKIDVAIVGEPTQMEMAVAEKGLLVIDGKSIGEPGHAAHGLGVNSIYQALKDVAWIQSYKFSKTSKSLGEVRMTVTQINAGHQHNVIPAICDFVVDVRVTDAYSNQEVLEIIQQHTVCDLQARSLRLNSSSIPLDHKIVQAGIAMGRKTYGSATLSDQAVLSCPSVKMGPGDTLRSHSANEFIYINEIEEGIEIYVELLSKVMQ